ncbi:MAG: nicotinate-nucleotide--dimethylbenzimidazole phosphoribosyltransferase [Cellulosilyticum sp.]|nr:nicotinate-nucleotide--dimethylbenzimidazole phosphoribosyltransferase [Cellulosilyticum sp.]
MTREDLFNIRINSPNQEIEKCIKKRWDSIAKPLDSMGEFEKIISKIGAILDTKEVDITKRAAIIMCADNGIVEEGISQSGQEVTALVAKAMGKGESTVNKLAKSNNTDVIVVDIGMNYRGVIEGVQNKKVNFGTKNFLKEPAMAEKEVLMAISIGIQAVMECKKKGYKMIATGEMGIGNTTTSSAIIAALLGSEAKNVVGRGAGLTNKALERKKQVVDEALIKYKLQKEDTFNILMTFGGLDIAGLVGVYIGGAIYHIPIVIDGIISVTAALVAKRLVTGTEKYMIASHKSKEPAMQVVLRELGLSSVIDAGLALGEGTGAIMLLSLLDMVLAIYRNYTSFEAIQVEQYIRQV